MQKFFFFFFQRFLLLLLLFRISWLDVLEKRKNNALDMFRFPKRGCES
jgi:hypothetical protein